MKQIKEIINDDIYRYYGETKKPIFWRLQYPMLYYTIIYRKAHFYNNRKVKKYFYNYLLKKISKKFGFNIPSKTTIGNGFFIGHNGPIIINSNAIIGSNCNIATNVTIGCEVRGKRKGCPIIGNNVWIGTSSTVVGKVIIGNNVLIAPNSFVNFSIPSNSIYVNGKIISSSNATEIYIQNKVGE